MGIPRVEVLVRDYVRDAPAAVDAEVVAQVIVVEIVEVDVVGVPMVVQVIVRGAQDNV